MSPTPQQVRRVYAEVRASERYREWWSYRRTDIPKWGRRLRGALRARGGSRVRDLVERQFYEMPIQTLDHRHREKALSDGPRLKTALSSLVDESVPIRSRFASAMDRDSKSSVPGLGRGALTEWLMFTDPKKYGVWNEKSRAGLLRLGMMPRFPRGASYGERYSAILDALQQVRAATGAKDLAEVDLFLHFVGAPEPEATAAWSKIIRGKMPYVPKGGSPGAGGGKHTPSRFLSEKGYARETPAAIRRVERLHNRLSNRMRRWLERRARATDVHQERSKTDLQCSYAGDKHLFELKIIGDVDGGRGGHYEVRQALGQLLDYSYFPSGEAKFDHLAIVTDEKPSDGDLEWVGSLSRERVVPPVEVFWFPEGSTEPFSCRLTRHPLAPRAARPLLP